jgi:hypothetical protein
MKTEGLVNKQIDKAVRAQKIKELTNNGKNRTMVRNLDNLMRDPETLAILNALFASTQQKEEK